MKGQIKEVYKNGETKTMPIYKAKYLEDLVIQKSILMFSDSDPCVLHKTHSIMRVSMDMKEAIKDWKFPIQISIEEESIVWEYLDRNFYKSRNVKELMII